MTVVTKIDHDCDITINRDAQGYIVTLDDVIYDLRESTEQFVRKTWRFETAQEAVAKQAEILLSHV